jgi:aspartate/methionine/tyrosine aminotransferase
MQLVQDPVIPVVAELIQQNPGTISLGQGVVAYPPPPEAFEMIQTFAAQPANNLYQHVQGIEPLVRAIEQKLDGENGIRSPGAVVVTAGSNMGFLNAILAIADPGDEVIVLSPFYFNHEMAINIAGCRARVVSTDQNYQPDIGKIEAAISASTRAVVTISPNNPTGAVYSESTLRAVNGLCRDRGLYHISDEAYEYFVYAGATHFSPGAIDDSGEHTISLFSLSKAYGFASWRIGYMVIPQHLCAAVKKIQDTNVICPPVISQYAACGALRAGAAYCRPHIEGLDEVRKTVMRALGSLGSRVEIPEATGALYVLARVNARLHPMDVTERLVRDHAVAVIPGSAFGIESPCCLRIAYAALDKKTVVEGIGRCVEGLGSILDAV